jgi:hypothetical protein
MYLAADDLEDESIAVALLRAKQIISNRLPATFRFAREGTTVGNLFKAL